MKNNTRRSFIKGSAAAGIAMSGPIAALNAHAAVADLDRSVARVLASYGTARSVETTGRTTRITIDANGIQPLADSFERLARLSDSSVHVENDNATFEYGKTTYVIENRLS